MFGALFVSLNEIKFEKHTNRSNPLKFTYSEKATKFCEISTIDLTITTSDISMLESHKGVWPSQNIWTYQWLSFQHLQSFFNFGTKQSTKNSKFTYFNFFASFVTHGIPRCKIYSFTFLYQPLIIWNLQKIFFCENCKKESASSNVWSL